MTEDVPLLREASLLACKRSARERLLIVADWINDLFAAANCRTRRGAVSSESLICAKARLSNQPSG